MMKIPLYILCLILSQTVLGQITYEPTFINQCTKEVEGVFYYISGQNYSSQISSFERKSISLPKLGKYQLYINFDENPINIEITKKGLTRDTLFLKRLNITHYVSNPPYSEYTDCDSLANGEVIDFYSYGNKRMLGVFKNGQSIDSLFSFYRNGQLSSLITPREKNYKMFTYFENGQMRSIYDTKKGYEKEFYWNGNVKKEYFWSKKNRWKSKEYNEEESLFLYKSNRSLREFSSAGNLVEQINRKELFKLSRFFSRNKSRFYEYTWDSFDINGDKTRTIVFYDSGVLGTPYPSDYNEIKEYLFERIVFYKNGNPTIKVHFPSKLEGDAIVRYMVLAKMIGSEWKVEKETTTENVYNTIAVFSE